MLTVGMFHEHHSIRKRMNQQFNQLGYDLANKRYILGQVLGYVPNLKDLTPCEMEQVIGFLNGESVQVQNKVE